MGPYEIKTFKRLVSEGIHHVHDVQQNHLQNFTKNPWEDIYQCC